MKKLRYILLFLTLMGSVSCNDFLEETSYGSIFVDDAMSTTSGATRFIYSIYNSYRDHYKNNFIVLDTGTDDQTCKDGADEIAQCMAKFNQNNASTTTITTAFWIYLYQGINKANFVIDEFPKTDFDVDFINESVAEARCLRAFAYFHLVRLWGDVPMVDWFVERDNYAYTEDLPREKAINVYEQIIIPDLVYASEYGVDYQEMQGRVTKWTAMAILGDVYMTLAGDRYDCLTGDLIPGDESYWAKARDIAWTAISECTSYSLLTDPGSYASAYERIWKEEYSSESLFEIGYIAESGQGSSRTNLSISTGKGSFWNDNPVFTNPDATTALFSSHVSTTEMYAIPTPDLYHAFEDGDERKWGVMTSYTLNAGSVSEIVYITRPTLTKFIDFYTALRDGTEVYNLGYDCQNARVIRFAELLLIFAEADNEANKGGSAEGLKQINRIRDRAGLPELATTGTYEEWQATIRHERRMELFGEHKRRYDLIRWNTFAEETREYDVTWLRSDNPYYDENGVLKGYNMVQDHVYMETQDDIQRELGCQTLTEMPKRSVFMCIQAEVLTLNPEWPQNYGYN